MIKKNFLTGLAILTPIAMTFAMVQFLVNLFTTPFLDIVEAIFGKNNWLEQIFRFLADYNLTVPAHRIFILIILTATIVSTGYSVRHLTIQRALHYFDKMIHRIPGFNYIYKAIQDTVRSVLQPASANFSRAVIVPYPHSKSYAVGFVTDEPKFPDECKKVTVFIPATPNLTNGFMLLFDEKEVHYIEMSVEEAIKFIVSCGIMFPHEEKTPSTINPNL